MEFAMSRNAVAKAESAATQAIAASRETTNIIIEYLEPEQLAHQLGVTRRTLYRWHLLRVGPPRTVIGRTILYRRASVAAWLAAREERLAARR
jgi:predicted DNA-binding transcriptional regulator AlpA